MNTTQEPLTLSVVMATFDDFNGVYFTVQSLLLHHGNHINEIVVVDNNPESPQGKTTRGFIESLGKHSVRYIPFTETNGTANTRELAIRSATSDIVLCTDPHVLFPTNSIKSLVEYFNANRDSRDLVQGPLLYDNGVQISTHFNLDIWRGQMWGTWDTDPRGNGTEPFEIPAQGLGMFAMLRKHWLGFNPNFRGFGGEEGYIHTKYRQSGAKCLCLPGALWVHRFGRPDGVPYPLTVLDKARNYVIGHKELGLDIEPIRQHFVVGGSISTLDWRYIKEGEYPRARSCASCVGEEFETLEEWHSYARLQQEDINEHADTLQQYALGKIVVDYGHRPAVSSVALASTASSYTMAHPGQPPEYAHIAKFLGKKNVPCALQVVKEEVPTLPPCQVLFIDTVHTYDYIRRILEKNAPNVRDYIILHDTVVFGEIGEDGSNPGMMQAIREYVRANPRWTVQDHYHNQHGLMILSGNPDHKPKLPGVLRQASNFTKALAKHVANGAQKVPLELYETRLIECDLCPSRVKDRCSECGCFIEEKASWESSECPLAKW